MITRACINNWMLNGTNGSSQFLLLNIFALTGLHAVRTALEPFLLGICLGFYGTIQFVGHVEKAQFCAPANCQLQMTRQGSTERSWQDDKWRFLLGSTYYRTEFWWCGAAPEIVGMFFACSHVTLDRIFTHILVEDRRVSRMTYWWACSLNCLCRFGALCFGLI